MSLVKLLLIDVWLTTTPNRFCWELTHVLYFVTNVLVLIHEIIHDWSYQFWRSSGLSASEKQYKEHVLTHFGCNCNCSKYVSPSLVSPKPGILYLQWLLVRMMLTKHECKTWAMALAYGVEVQRNSWQLRDDRMYGCFDDGTCMRWHIYYIVQGYHITVCSGRKGAKSGDFNPSKCTCAFIVIFWVTEFVLLANFVECIMTVSSQVNFATSWINILEFNN